MNCPACRKQTEEGDRFCANCGAVLAASQPAPATGPMELAPCGRIAIEFAQSASATFARALDFAKRLPSFSECGGGKAKIFRVELGWEEWPGGLELIETLTGWRNRWIYIDGEKRDWSEVLYFLYCFNVRKRAYSPEHHCIEGEFKNDVHPFGCIHSGLSLVWPTSGWLQAGEFDSGTVFHFDKSGIRKIMEENLFRVRFCPALDLKRALEVLELFPDQANPTRDHRWQYDTYPAHGAPPKNSVSVTIRREGGWTERGEAYGVRASSRQAAIAILAEIARKLRNTRLPVLSIQP